MGWEAGAIDVSGIGSIAGRFFRSTAGTSVPLETERWITLEGGFQSAGRGSQSRPHMSWGGAFSKTIRRGGRQPCGTVNTGRERERELRRRHSARE